MLSEPEKKEFLEIVQDFKQKLRDKARKHYAVIQRVEWWTKRQPFLTRKVCSLILESQSAIYPGEEATIVDKLVRTRLVENWENQVAAEHLKKIRDSILESDQRASLLRLYQQILQSGTIAANSSQEQQVLLESKLVVEQEGQLRVYNPIYEAVFHRDWVAQELGKYEQSLNSQSTTTENQNMEDNTEDEKSLSRLQKSQSRLPFVVPIVSVIIVIVVGFLAFRERQEPQNGNNPLPDPSTTNPETCGSDLIQEVENAITWLDENRLEQIVNFLKNKRQQQGDTFDEECEKILYEAQYEYAIGIKAERYSNFKDAAELLCEIPEEYHKNINAKPWFKRWYKKPGFSEQLKEYLDPENNKCPAATYLNRDIPPATYLNRDL